MTYDLFNSISVISERWADDNARLCAMEPCLRLKKVSPSGGARTRDRYICLPALNLLRNRGSIGNQDPGSYSSLDPFSRELSAHSAGLLNSIFIALFTSRCITKAAQRGYVRSSDGSVRSSDYSSYC